jgi:hypothetical protein
MPPGYRFGENSRLHPLFPVASKYAPGKQRRQKHHPYSNNVESRSRHGPDNASGIERLAIHHVITMITTAHKKNEYDADNKHDDKASLTNFIGKGIFRNLNDGGKCIRYFHVNLSPT